VPVEALTTADFPRGRDREAQDAEATAMSDLTARELWETIEQEFGQDEQTDGFHHSFGLAPSAGGLEPRLSLSRGG
jgi:hypothetical protein